MKLLSPLIFADHYVDVPNFYLYHKMEIILSKMNSKLSK